MKWRRDGVSCRESCKWNGKGNPNNRAQRVKIFEATPLHQLMKIIDEAAYPRKEDENRGGYHKKLLFLGCGFLWFFCFLFLECKMCGVGASTSDLA